MTNFNYQNSNRFIDAARSVGKQLSDATTIPGGMQNRVLREISRRQPQVPAYPGGMLPEVTVTPDNTPYYGGMLPEVTVTPENTPYYGGMLPEVTITADNANQGIDKQRPVMPSNVPVRAFGGPVLQNSDPNEPADFPKNPLTKPLSLPKEVLDSIKGKSMDELWERLPMQKTDTLPSFEGIENLPYYPGSEKGGIQRGPYIPSNDDPQDQIKTLPYYPGKHDSIAKVIPYKRPLLQKRGGKLVEVWE